MTEDGQTPYDAPENSAPAYAANAPMTQVEYLQNRAALAPLVCADIFGTPLTAGVEALPQLEQVLTHSATREEREAVITTFGAFLGETLRNTHGGEWHEDEDQGWGIANAGAPGTFVNPFEWVKQGDVGTRYDAWRRAMPTSAKLDP